MSNNQDTRYLYSKENASVYRGFLEEHNNSECMYARNLVAIMDSQTSKMNSFYENHIIGCKVCQDIAQTASWKNQRIRSLIPIIEVPTTLEAQIKSDLKEALSLHKKHLADTRPSFGFLVMLNQSIREIFGTRLILKSLFQGCLIALSTYILLWTIRF